MKGVTSKKLKVKSILYFLLVLSYPTALVFLAGICILKPETLSKSALLILGVSFLGQALDHVLKMRTDYEL